MAATLRSFRMNDDVFDSLGKLADLEDGNASETLRSLIPRTGLRCAFGYLKTAGLTGGRNYSDWLHTLAAERLRDLMQNDEEYPLDNAFLPQPGTDPRRTFMRYAEWAAARDAIWYPDGRTRGQFETAMGGMPLDVALVKNPATGKYGLLRADQVYNADGGIEQAAPRRARK